MPEHRGSHVHPGEETADCSPRGGLEDQRLRSRQRLHPVHCGCTHVEERSESTSVMGKLNTNTFSTTFFLHLSEVYVPMLNSTPHHGRVQSTVQSQLSALYPPKPPSQVAVLMEKDSPFPSIRPRHTRPLRSGRK